MKPRMKVEATRAPFLRRIATLPEKIDPARYAGETSRYAVAEGVKLGPGSETELGTTLATADWPGGNIRPWREIEGREPPPTERAQPYAFRPTLVARSDGLHAYWWGAYWESDDQGSEALYERTLAWPDAGGEPADRNLLLDR